MREKIEELLRNESNYALEFNFARQFSELTGRPETSVLQMVRNLTTAREHDVSLRRVRGKHEIALRGAVEAIWDWYNKADSYREMSTSVALDMLESHDPACIWAVILGQSAKAVIA